MIWYPIVQGGNYANLKSIHQMLLMLDKNEQSGIQILWLPASPQDQQQSIGERLIKDDKLMDKF